MRKIFLSTFFIVTMTHYSFAEKNNDVIAKVNNIDIYRSAYDMTASEFEKSGMPVTDDIKAKILDQLIEQKLLASTATEKHVQDNPTVKNRLDFMKDMILRDAYLENYINTHLSDSVVEAEHKKRMKNFVPPIEYHAAHILVQDKETANKITSELKDGKKFTDLAKQYSKDSNAKDGGDLGYFVPEMMVKAFGDTVKTLKVGNISAPVQTEFGWHIIKLIDKRKKAVPDFATVKDNLKTEMAHKLISDHVADLKAKADIKKYDKE